MARVRYRVLILDDSPEDRELYRRFLLKDQSCDYSIIEAETGQEGLNHWQHDRPDVMLLDYRLPDLDGLEILAQLHCSPQPPCLPVVMLTGMGNEAIAVQAMKAGAQDYLVKEQITSEGLHFAVQKAIETVQLHTQLQQRIRREQIVSQITRQIHTTLDLNEILQTTVDEVRRFLHTDRVLIFQLQSNNYGVVMAESVGTEWTPLLSISLYDACFNDSYVEPFRLGLVTVKSDIYDGSINPCHVELLANLQVRANLVVPIVQDGQLWGMLIAHHCAAPRQWEALEVDLLKELATQVGIAVKQAELYQQVHRELAERRRVEAALQQSENFKQRVLDSSVDCIKVLDLNGRLLYMNKNGLCLMEIEDFRRYQNAEWVSFWQDAHHQSAESALVNAKEGMTSRFQGFCTTAKGTPKWWEVIVCPILDVQGRVERILSVSRDVSDRVRLEQEREQILVQEQAARREAEQANRIKDEFLAVLSHELRSPLNPILGWAKLLRSGKLDTAKAEQALQTIERNAHLQSELIEDLLDVSRILQGQLSLNVSPVNLMVVIRAAIDTMRLAIEAKSIQIEANLVEVGQVLGDVTRLQQVLGNLLSNAVKFTPPNGLVKVRLEKLDNQAQITVHDTGKGIVPEFLPYVFDSFRQEDGATTRRFGGLGLGLAIVRQIVELHGGTARAESEGDGQGATFIVRLPLMPIQRSMTSEASFSSDFLDLSGVQVLVVDDEADSRDFIAFVVEQAGSTVRTVTSGAEAIEMLTHFQPDVLLSDIGMPEMDGYMLMRQVRSLPPEQGGQVKAIALTAYAGEMNQQQALAAGFEEHLTKPIEPEKLVKAIGALLNRHKKST